MAVSSVEIVYISEARGSSAHAADPCEWGRTLCGQRVEIVGEETTDINRVSCRRCQKSIERHA